MLLTGEELPDTKLVYTIVLGVCYRFDLYLHSFGKTSVKGKVVRTFQKIRNTKIAHTLINIEKKNKPAPHGRGLRRRLLKYSCDNYN